MTPREWLTQNGPELYPNTQARYSACARATGASRNIVKGVAYRMRKTGGEPPAPAPDTHHSKLPPPVGMSRAAFAAKYDQTTRTRAALSQAVTGLTDDNEIIPDQQFRDRAGITTLTGYRQIAEETQFRAYQWRVGDTVYWGTPATRDWAIRTVSRARDL